MTIWYDSGTVTVANGSAIVDGTGTDFVAGVQAGHGFVGPNGVPIEVAQVISATRLVLARPYTGAGAGGQSYTIIPTTGAFVDVARRLFSLLGDYAAVRDGIGQGLFPDGTVAAPGLRFAADQDSGLYRSANNSVGIAAGGVAIANFDAAGVDVPIGKAFAYQPGAQNFTLYGKQVAHYGMTVGHDFGLGSPATVFMGYGGVILGAGGGERVRIDSVGNLLVGGTTSSGWGDGHRFCRSVAAGAVIAGIDNNTNVTALFHAGGSGLGSAAAASMRINRNDNTGRSINAAGTINASGADYAEYMTKVAGCGTIAAGDVCGVDIDGQLTRTWADAISFVVKSTDPAYVGGDTWAAGMAPRPEAPSAEPVEPAAPPPIPEDEEARDAWRAIVDAYPAQLVAWRAAHATWLADTAAYASDLAMWEAALEAERVKVDRIAFCGQVPVNVTGDFAVGDYLIAAAAGAGIKAVAIAEADITFDQYRRRIGKVWAVRDGRAWVDVQHG